MLQKALPEQTTLYNGVYTIVHPLGAGGFGITYLARHHLLGDVAIKELFLNSGNIYCTREELSGRTVVPQFDLAQFAKFKERFHNEAKTIYGLRKVRGVVNVLDIFEENGTVYFSMEYLKGEKLDDYVRNRYPLPEKECESIVLSLCETMAQVHSRQVLHCDIKPSNIIVSPEGEITLIDFGIARYYEISDDNATRAAIYSPGYSSPEQKIPNEPLGTYSDVFSLGATAYFVFTGQPPQSMDERVNKGYVSPRSLNPDIPLSIETAINQSLEPRSQDRPQTITSFLQLFTQSADATTIEKPIPVSEPVFNKIKIDKDVTQIEQVKKTSDDTLLHNEPIKAPGRNHRALYWMAAMLLVGLMGGVGWFFFRKPDKVAAVNLPPMPEYKVRVVMEREQLFTGENQGLQIKTEPVPDSGSLVSIFVNGKKIIENSQGIIQYTSEPFPNTGSQKQTVRIEVVRGADKQVKTDSSIITFRVSEKKPPPPPVAPNISLSALASSGTWFSQMPNRPSVEIALGNNLGHIDDRGNVGKVSQVPLEDGSVNTGLEFAPGTRIPGAKVGGTIKLPRELPANAVFKTKLGFRNRVDRRATVAYEIRVNYTDGAFDLLSRGTKRYDGNLKVIEMPIRRNAASIYFEVNSHNIAEKERVVLVNPRIVRSGSSTH